MASSNNPQEAQEGRQLEEPRDTPEVIPGHLIEIQIGRQQLHGSFKLNAL